MADTGIYATTTQIQAFAGAGASATSKAEAYTNAYVLLAENVINGICRKIFAVDQAAFTALNAGVKYLLSDAAASLAAIYVIQYDFSGYPSRIVAEDMINILRDAFLRDISILRDKKTQDFLMDPTAGGG